MDLTARDIHEKQFHDSWRGYNQEEVDEFLDRIADVLDRLQRENSALNARVTELDHAVATSRDTEEMLKKTLITAQQAAEEAIASAKAKAEALIQEAEERTRRVHREADEKLQSADAEARRKSLEADREHTIRKREIDASLEKLRRFESDLKRRLAAFLTDQTRALERLTEEDPPRLEPAQQKEEDADFEDTGDPGETRATHEHGGGDEESPAVNDLSPDDDASADSEGEHGGPLAHGDDTSQWIPHFVASREVEGSEAGSDEASQAHSATAKDDPDSVKPADIAALYPTGELSAVDADDAIVEGEPETVTLAEEETAPARQRSRSLFWRNDG